MSERRPKGIWRNFLRGKSATQKAMKKCPQLRPWRSLKHPSQP